MTLKIKDALRLDLNPREIEVLLQHTLNVSRAYLYAHSEYPLSPTQINALQHAMTQRQQGKPIAYITGQRAFWNFELHVTADTLIPRPETERLIEITLSLLDASTPRSILDLGTGSGAIALALAMERPQWHITACDYSPDALNIATRNAERLGLHHINFILSDWLQAFEHRQFDVILANPPYLAATDPHLQQGDLRFEPKSALISGQTGLEALHIIIQDSYKHLAEYGMLLVEHGYEQGLAVQDLFHQYGYHATHCWQDWQGHDRVSGGKKILHDLEKSAIIDPYQKSNNFNKSEKI